MFISSLHATVPRWPDRPGHYGFRVAWNETALTSLGEALEADFPRGASVRLSADLLFSDHPVSLPSYPRWLEIDREVIDHVALLWGNDERGQAGDALLGAVLKLYPINGCAQTGDLDVTALSLVPT
jgi:hypothetical protein